MGCGASKVGIGGRPTITQLRQKFDANNRDNAANDPDAVPASKFLRSGASLKRIIETNSVLVVVRVRPLSQKETASGDSGMAVKLTSNQALSIRSQQDAAASERQFSFDACFSPEASQQDVYDRSGRMVLGKVLDGFNGCVFAYGQTGSGKTFTMQGTPDAPGVIPRLCAELFERIRTLEGKKHVAVHASMCEIYNERLNDLLTRGSAEETSSRDLKIREEEGAGGRGIYVDGLSEICVDSSEAILALLADGTSRRAIGRTDM
jgi:hypothetical protein